MDRSEWMYRMKRIEPQYLVHVRKFVAVAKAHCERLDQTTTICPCSHCKNMKAHKDSEVQSHLIRFGFVKDYTVWTFHGKKVVDATVGDASGGNSTLLTTINAEHVGRQPATSSAAATSDGNARDVITMEDLFEDMATDDDGGGDGDEDAAVRDPEGAELMEEIANRLDKDDILFGSSWWLENFKEMKQAAIDPLYEGCLKHWMTQRFDLQMLMLKARHG
jgi:hypothetical protein